MNTKQIVLVSATLAMVALMAERAGATPIIGFGPLGGTYTYNTASPSGADPNATLSSTAWTHESNPAYDTYYFVPSGNVGTVSYTFQANPGRVFSSGTAQESYTIFFGGSTSNMTTSVSTNLNPTPVTINSLVGTSDVVSSDATDALPIAGASTFTVTYTLTNQAGNPIYLQLGREDNANATSDSGSGLAPFVITTVEVSAPEPASWLLSGLSSAGLGVAAWRRRRATKRA